jgi:hypothetical protein
MRRILAAAFAVWLVSAGAARACDVCAIYTATEMRETRVGLRVGIAEQFSHFAERRVDGDTVANPDDERLNSSITQLLVGYNVIPRLGVQLALPIIVRSFRRLEVNGIARGEEAGVGDLTLLANAIVLSHVDLERVLHLSLLGGLKLPSGSPERLEEEVAAGGPVCDPWFPPSCPERDGGGAQHVPGVNSAVHGHDLALGSGSVDGIVGAQLFGSWQRFYFSAVVQYALRSAGHVDYQYADELLWSGGPGAFVLAQHAHTLGLQAVIAGETKGKDTLDDVPQNDTGITSLYAGPGVTFTWGDRLSVDLIGDIPVIQNNTGVQLVPDYRLRAGIVWRF